MHTAQGMNSVNRNEDFGTNGDSESRKETLSRIPSRIAMKTIENVKHVARDLPAQLKKSPGATIGIGIGLVGIALAAVVAPIVFAPKRPLSKLEKLVGRKNIKRAMKQLRALGLY